MGIIKLSFNKTIQCDCCGNEITEKEWYKYNTNYTKHKTIELPEILNATCSEPGVDFLQICPICGYITGFGLSNEYDMESIMTIVGTDLYQNIKESEIIPLVYKKWRLLACLCSTLNDSYLTAIASYKLYDIVTELNLDIEPLEGFTNDNYLRLAVSNILGLAEGKDFNEDNRMSFYVLFLLDMFRRLNDKENFNLYYTFIKENIQGDEAFNKIFQAEVTLFENNDYSKKKVFM